MQIIEEEQVIPKISKVAFINRAGLGLLMRAHQSLGESKIRLFREMTEVYGLQDLTIPNIEQTITLSSPEAQPSSSGSHKLSTTPRSACYDIPFDL
jgi:hypothetical protein